MLLLAGLCVNVATAEAPDPFNLLIYNTHGLPAIFAKDDPESRFPRIANLTHAYDLILLQEDFAHHQTLIGGLKENADVVRGLNAVSPPCFFCSASGLTFISHLHPAQWSLQHTFFEFDACSGWLSRANECFAQKGFQMIRLEAKSGQLVYLINTHLDAGRTTADQSARKLQLQQIVSVIKQIPQGAALIVGGDLNLDWDSPKDRELLHAFRDRLNLVRAVGGIQASNGWQILDYVYFRSGHGTRLRVTQSGEDPSFQHQSRPLSDHPALFVNFSVY